MKFLFEFLPIILFFGAFKFFDIYVATSVAIICTLFQIIYLKIKKQKVELMQWMSLILITVFGGITLISHNEMFIKWKPSILYWSFAVVLLIGKLFLNKNFIKKLMEAQLKLPDIAWNNLNIMWIVFFIIMGGLNIWIAYIFDTDTWVNFKLFGSLGLTIIFMIIQGIYMSRFMKEQNDSFK